MNQATKQKIAVVAATYLRIKPTLIGLNVNANKAQKLKLELTEAILDVLQDLPGESKDIIETSVIRATSNTRKDFFQVVMIHKTIGTRNYSFDINNMEALFNDK